MSREQYHLRRKIAFTPPKPQPGCPHYSNPIQPNKSSYSIPSYIHAPLNFSPSFRSLTSTSFHRISSIPFTFPVLLLRLLLLQLLLLRCLQRNYPLFPIIQLSSHEILLLGALELDVIYERIWMGGFLGYLAKEAGQVGHGA